MNSPSKSPESGTDCSQETGGPACGFHEHGSSTAGFLCGAAKTIIVKGPQIKAEPGGAGLDLLAPLSARLIRDPEAHSYIQKGS